MTAITIQVGDEEFSASLTGDDSPETIALITDALPIQSIARQWGDEIYFEIPVQCDEENAKSTVNRGDLGYWPAGNCFCIFYGRTPMSPSEDEIVPASPVNVVGRIENTEGLKAHAAGEKVTVRLAE
jgi:hypothetical protein